MTPDDSGGYVATFAVGVSGLTGAAGGAPTDTAVTSALSGARFSRSANGTRVLTLTLAIDEAVTADARVVRGVRTLVRRAATALQPGTRRIALTIPRATARGPARLRLTLRDGAGNSRQIHRSLQIPSR